MILVFLDDKLLMEIKLYLQMTHFQNENGHSKTRTVKK